MQLPFFFRKGVKFCRLGGYYFVVQHCPEMDVYFVNKDGERLRIDPSGKLGVRLVELTQKYLQINEKDIKTKFEKDVRIFRDSLPITVLPNARAFYR